MTNGLYLTEYWDDEDEDEETMGAEEESPIEVEERSLLQHTSE